jgi:hypothetical protein
VDLVEYVNTLHWDGPLRGRLACIARHSSTTEIEITVGLDEREPTVFSILRPVRATCDDAAAVTKQIVATAEHLVAAEVGLLLRRGSKPQLHVPTMRDVGDALAEALGNRDWSSPVAAIKQIVVQRDVAVRALDKVTPRPWSSVLDDDGHPDDDLLHEWIVEDAYGNEIYRDDHDLVDLVDLVNALPDSDARAQS